MKILILDVYSLTSARISKDTAGGFGTVNFFGTGIVPLLLTKLKNKAVDYPPLYSMYCAAVLRDSGHDVKYLKMNTKEINDASFKEFDICFITCYETNVKFLEGCIIYFLCVHF